MIALILSFCLRADFLYAQDPFKKLRAEDIKAKEKRAGELAQKAGAFEKQLGEEQRQNKTSQEKMWKDFIDGLEAERGNLQGKILALEGRRRSFEAELEKNRGQDELRAHEKQNEIQLLMLESRRLQAEAEQDKKIFEDELGAAKNRSSSESAPDSSSIKDALQAAEGKILGSGAFKINPESGRPMTEGSPFQTRLIRPEYYLEIGDVLEIDVWRVSDFSRVVIVRPDGRISLPLVGDLYVFAMSLIEVRDILTKKLSEYIRNPQVSISMRQFGGRKFVILGEINTPGVYRFQQEISLLEGVALAGGFKPDAKRGKIMVIRGDIRKEPQVKIIKANVENVLKKGMISENLLIMPNDIVYVAKDLIGDYREILDNLVQPALDNSIDFFVLRSAIRTAQGRRN